MLSLIAPLLVLAPFGLAHANSVFAEPVPMESGLEVTFHDVIQDVLGDGLTYRFRFVAPQIGAGLGFMDVGKSTTHYVGSSPEELHDNMRVRNIHYQKPGPASTGLPVFGFLHPASKVVVDLVLRTRD